MGRLTVHGCIIGDHTRQVSLYTEALEVIPHKLYIELVQNIAIYQFLLYRGGHYILLVSHVALQLGST